jgi:hypothetical protein
MQLPLKIISCIWNQSSFIFPLDIAWVCMHVYIYICIYIYIYVIFVFILFRMYNSLFYTHLSIYVGSLYLSESMKINGNSDKTSEYNDKKSYILNSIEAFEEDLKHHPHNIWYKYKCMNMYIFLYVYIYIHM